MKRILILFAVCLLLCLPLACAKKTAETPAAPAVTVPETVELTLTLPLGSRDGVLKQLPAYTAGFRAMDGGTLTFAVSSADPSVAEGILKDDGTLYVIAHGTGETKLSVTAVTVSGEENAATVSVNVRDARRALVMIVLGILSVALLVLLGKPSAKKPDEVPEPEETPEPAPTGPEETSDPVVIFEEPKDNTERS